jgi:hypothetical protein
MLTIAGGVILGVVGLVVLVVIAANLKLVIEAYIFAFRKRP